jgi:hypothetical protein
MIRGLAQTEMSGQSLEEDPFPKYDSLSVLRSFVFGHLRLMKEEITKRFTHISFSTSYSICKHAMSKGMPRAGMKDVLHSISALR